MPAMPRSAPKRISTKRLRTCNASPLPHSEQITSLSNLQFPACTKLDEKRLGIIDFANPSKASGSWQFPAFRLFRRRFYFEHVRNRYLEARRDARMGSLGCLIVSSLIYQLPNYCANLC